MEEIEIKSKLVKESGAVWLLPLVLVGVVALGVYGVNYLGNKNQVQKVKLALESLIQKDAFYLDEARVIGSSTDYSVFMTLKTEGGDYALAKLIDAELKEDVFDGPSTIELPNGEYASGDYGSFLTGVTLKDGKEVDAQIIDKAVAVVRLRDGTFIPIKIVNGKIKAGKLEGVFSGRTFDAGYKVAGLIENRKVTDGYVVASPSSISASSRILAYIATVESRLTYDSTSYLANVLALEEDVENEPTSQSVAEEAFAELEDPRNVLSFEGKILVPNYESGTFQLVGDEDEGVDLAALKGVVADSLAGALDLVSPELGVFLTDDSVLSRHIKDGTITTDDVSDNTVTSAKIASGAIENSDLKDGAVNSAKIENETITSSDISDNTITTSDLYSTLTFASGDFIDLSAVTHSTTSQQGLLLPNASSATPSNPSTGEGYIAWDMAGNQVIAFNGTSWNTISGVTLTTSGTSSSTFSNSGLELDASNRLSLLRGCSDTEILKWSSTNVRWECQPDAGAAGASKWTDGGAFTYLTATTDDLVVGGSTVAGASLFFDESAGQLDLGTEDALSGAIKLYSSGVGVTDATISTNASGDIILNPGGSLTIAAGDTIGNGTWSIASTGVGTALTANDLSCTDCIGVTEISAVYLLNTGDTSTGSDTFGLGATELITIDG